MFPSSSLRSGGTRQLLDDLVKEWNDPEFDVSLLRLLCCAVPCCASTTEACPGACPACWSSRNRVCGPRLPAAPPPPHPPTPPPTHTSLPQFKEGHVEGSYPDHLRTSSFCLAPYG